MRISMRRPWSTGAVIGVVAVLLLSACQTDGMRDASGRGVQVSEWKTIDVSEVDLNLPLLLAQKVTKVEYQLRDNKLYHHRLHLDGDKGMVFTQYIWDAWYDDAAEKSLDDIEVFKKKLSSIHSGAVAGTSDIRKIERKGKRTVGFAAVSDVRDPAKGKCFLSHAGYRVKSKTIYDNDWGNIDAIVVIQYCDPAVTIADFSRALENIDRVKDRAVFAAALAAK